MTVLAPAGLPRPTAPTVGAVAPDEVALRRVVDALIDDGLDVVARCMDPTDLATAAGEAPIDVAVLVAIGEASDPQGGVRSVISALPECGVVAVLPSGDGRAVRRCLRAGAVGVVSEPTLATALAVTVRAVHAGQVSVAREHAHRLDRQSLSHRERQILGMVVLGFTNAEIAARLFLAESTVKSHLSTAFAKLGVRSRKDAATLILDPEEGLGPGILAITDTGTAKAGPALT